MTDSPTPDQTGPDPSTVDGGGRSPQDPMLAAVRAAAEKLELLSPETRETVLSRMDGAIAQRIRDYLASLPDRPHGQFTQDVAERRRMLHDTANRIQSTRAVKSDAELAQLEELAARPSSTMSAAMGGAPTPIGDAKQPAEPSDPLDRLRELHPAAIARAMQGERAEAWAIVLDRLDVNARAALQLYLDASARAAIEDARTRQAELAQSSPALLATVVAAIAKTVVPRAMREHHQLLSTTPLAWTGMPA
jgi:hypothetical protein